MLAKFPVFAMDALRDGMGLEAGGTISFRERAGKPGGGKGILISNDHTGALSTVNNQGVLYSADSATDSADSPVETSWGFEPGAAIRLNPESRFSKELAPTLRADITDLGAKIGASANRRPVAKIDQNGTPVAFYSSARGGGKKEYKSLHEAAIDVGGYASNILRAINSGKRYKGILWSKTN